MESEETHGSIKQGRMKDFCPHFKNGSKPDSNNGPRGHVDQKNKNKVKINIGSAKNRGGIHKCHQYLQPCA